MGNLAKSILISLAAFQCIPAYAQNEDLEDLARSRPLGSAGIPEQWFEMESTLGWEKMMLGFGYADNKTVCEELVKIAKDGSPDRNFRCRDSN